MLHEDCIEISYSRLFDRTHPLILLIVSVVLVVLLSPVIAGFKDSPTVVAYGLFAALAVLLGRSAFVLPLFGRLSMRNMICIGVLSGLAIIAVSLPINMIATRHLVSTRAPVEMAPVF